MPKALRGLAACLGVLAVCVPLVLWCASPADPGTTSTSSTVGPAVRIRIAAVGDVLTHLQIIDSARDYRTGGYDFAPIFAPIAPYLSAADYTIANLETRLAGAGEGFSGYPLLNSPDELAAGLKSAGIDLLATANNHSLDQGWEGVLATLDTVEAAGLAHVGTYRSRGERDVPFVVGVSGIKLAFLNYTAETNGLPLPRGREFAVGVLDPLTVAGDVRAARARGAELVIAILHYGNEYARIPSGSQVKVSEQLLAAGVDAI
ncbi:MAG TPA: CapA family protein, partial [Thermoleophilia bacterium]